MSSSMIQTMLAEEPHAPCVKNFDITHEHPTRLDHHLHADPPAVIALRSRLRLNSSLLNSSLKKKKMKASSQCDHCPCADETLEHVILDCPRYDSARHVFIQSFHPKPPNSIGRDEMDSVCLGMSPDHSLKGRKPTHLERASATFLLSIASSRPDI